MLGFKDKQLGWVFVAGAIVLFLFGASQGRVVHEWFYYRSDVHELILAITLPVILYAIMRALEAGRRKGDR